MSTTKPLTRAITDAVLSPRISSLHIDLGAVTFLAAAGINTLVTGRNLTTGHNNAYQVGNARGVVRRVLSITDVLDTLRPTTPPGEPESEHPHYVDHY